MMRALGFLLLVGLAACAPERASGPARVEVAGAVCRPAAPGRDVTGCYATLTASGDDRLVSISSPTVREVEVHDMKTENGLMSMAPMSGGLPLPAGETVALAPGGKHLMLFGATGPLAEGGTLTLAMAFERAPPQQVEFRIGQPG